MEDELAADWALEARAAHERQELLVERAIEGHDLRHSRPEDPDHLAEDLHVGRLERLEVSFSGWSRMRAVFAEEALDGRLVGRLVVTDERDDDFPVAGVLLARTTT